MNMEQERIAIQGIEGSFHQEAANHYFRDASVVPASTFGELIRLAEDDRRTDGAIIAMENSIVGSIMPNYLLLLESGLHVIGEVYLRIVQNLMVVPGQKLEDLDEVHSHPMAIEQCRKFFRSYPHIQLVEKKDTALSAKEVMENNWKNIGAIAGREAAELYGLEMIYESIETVKNNFTRFLILSREPSREEGSPNKASIHFKTAHQPGSLAKVLNVIAGYNMNLSKIQSFPIVQQEWLYYFHADVEFDDLERYRAMIKDLEGETDMLKILGVYKKGETIL